MAMAAWRQAAWIWGVRAGADFKLTHYLVAPVPERCGDRPGLVHILVAMESRGAGHPWHGKQTHKTFMRPDRGKCVHYYFYFMDARFGLMYQRLPAWCSASPSPPGRPPNN